MRQQLSDSTGKPSRLCRFLLFLVGFKICLLGVILLEPYLNLGFLFSSEQVAVTWQEEKAKPELNAETPQTPPAANSPSGVSVASVPVSADSGAPAAASGNTANAGQPEVAPASAPAPRQVIHRRAPGVAFAASSGPAGQPDVQPGQSGLTLEALTRKQEELGRKEQDLKLLQEELDARLLQMQELEMRLQVMLKDAEEMKDARYRHLVDVLSNMKARQAAEVLATLDERIAVRVLAGMRGRQAGEILSFAQPAKAARLAESLARIQMPFE